MVSRLGGPSIASEELDWALDTPTGARIMDFFLSKVQSGNKSLVDVAMEKEERDMFVVNLSPLTDSEGRLQSFTCLAGRTHRP